MGFTPQVPPANYAGPAGEKVTGARVEIGPQLQGRAGFRGSPAWSPGAGRSGWAGFPGRGRYVGTAGLLSSLRWAG